MLIGAFLLLHVVTVCLFLNAKKRNKLSLDPYLTAILCLFPIMGAVSVIYIHKEMAKLASQPELSFEEMFPWLSDDSFVTDGDTRSVTEIDVQSVIPFQEALLLNNASVKRELIIDVIFEAPGQFIPLLHQARLNDDVEVVHYATTILSELTAKYDAKLRTLEKQAEKSQASLTDKKDYLIFLQQYIDSTLAEGYYGDRLKHRYAAMAQQLINQNLLLEKQYFTRLADIYLGFHEMQQFNALLEKMQLHFPDEEETWMLRLKAIIAKHSQQDLSDFLDELREKKIYLSAKNREILAFWQ